MKYAAGDTRRMVSGITLLVLLLGATGCATKAAPSRGAGFVPMEMMARAPELPFHKTWRRPGVDWDKYRSIYIAPVSTDFLLETSGWMQGERKGRIEADARKLAEYTRNEFEEAFRKDPNRRFRVAGGPSSTNMNMLVAEMALTEVVPSKVTLSLLGYVPYAGELAVRAIKKLTHTESVVAFEAQVLDSETGQVVAMFADREAEQEAPLNLKGLTWYSHAHSIIDEWADQFVRVANRDREAGEVVKDSKTFTLKPW